MLTGACDIRKCSKPSNCVRMNILNVPLVASCSERSRTNKSFFIDLVLFNVYSFWLALAFSQTLSVH